jgi:hypothetical protein
MKEISCFGLLFNLTASVCFTFLTTPVYHANAADDDDNGGDVRLFLTRCCNRQVQSKHAVRGLASQVPFPVLLRKTLVLIKLFKHEPDVKLERITKRRSTLPHIQIHASISGKRHTKDAKQAEATFLFQGAFVCGLTTLSLVLAERENRMYSFA